MSQPIPTSTAANESTTRRRWLVRTPFRTFVLYPAIVLVESLLVRRGGVRVDSRFALLLAWGCLQFRLVGDYRVGRGGGGPGIQVPPTDLVETGAYAFTRNPMYLAQLIFLLGLALTFRSLAGAAIFGANAAWFHQRVLEDEERLARQFGPRYEAYCARVKRWVPGLF
jgi:protein-S-isoprenylcysteine O-methyltransferase Ste14